MQITFPMAFWTLIAVFGHYKFLDTLQAGNNLQFLCFFMGVVNLKCCGKGVWQRQLFFPWLSEHLLQYLVITNFWILCKPEITFNFLLFYGGCQLEVCDRNNFFYAFNQQESENNVPLTTFSEAKNGLLVVKKAATYIHPWKSLITSKFMDRLV